MFADEIAREKVNKLIEAIKNKDSQKIEKQNMRFCVIARIYSI